MATLQSTDGPWATLAEVPLEIRKSLIYFVLVQRGDEIIRVWCARHVERDGGIYMGGALVDMGAMTKEGPNQRRYVVHFDLAFGGAWCWSIQDADLVGESEA